MHQAHARRRAIEAVAWCAAGAAVTLLLLAAEDRIDRAHVALTYLLIVLGASARGGRRLGLILSVACFFAFNFFFIPPFRTFAIHNPVDWLVLFSFLVTSAVATQLLHRAHSQADVAQQRALEVDRLAAIGAETLSSPRAEGAIQAIVEVVRAGLEVDACVIYAVDDDDHEPRLVAHSSSSGPSAIGAPNQRVLGRAAAGLLVAIRRDGSDFVADATGRFTAAGEIAWEGVRGLFIPLRAGHRVVGVLSLESATGIALDGSRLRFTEALAYYAALALERARLSSAEEHADALREADRLKDALLASVSHDLRTPLTTIKALAREIAVDGDERAYIIEEEADRLNRFVTDLLDLSRLNAGGASFASELVAAEDVLGAALQQVQSAHPGRTVTASIDSDEPVLVGRFDFVHTLSALVNLIDNAVKYSDGDVEVTMRRDGIWLIFDIADRGPGIPPEEADQVFEAFYRGTTAGKSIGTGLGLPIARRAVQLQGGSLACTPRTGGGTVFSIRLPAADISEIEMSL